jgi:hypothetical protein
MIPLQFSELSKVKPWILSEVPEHADKTFEIASVQKWTVHARATPRKGLLILFR